MCIRDSTYIVNIQGMGVQTMVDLQTTEGTYIAEGLVSHNTTFIQLFMLDRCLFNPDMKAGVIAHTREDASAFFTSKIKFAYDNLPEEIRKAVPAERTNVRELAFRNGSRISVGTSLRSTTLQYLHVSEYGKLCAQYPDKAAEVRAGALNTIAPGNFVFVESTACLLYTSPSPRDRTRSRMPSSA